MSDVMFDTICEQKGEMAQKGPNAQNGNDK
jgi:hypothetical protein